MNIFSKITQNETAAWTDDPFVDNLGRSINSGAYALSYELRGPGVAVTLNAIANGPGWKTTLAAADAAKLTPGTWWWKAYAIAAGEKIVAGEGSFIAEVDFVGAGAGYDARSQDEKDLAAIDAEISARASNGFTVEYMIGQRSLKKEPIAALLTLRSQIDWRIRRDKTRDDVANGLGNPRSVFVRFGG